MVLEYYGIHRELEDLSKALAYSGTGTSAYENGTLLLREGFKVAMVTAQPKLFSPDTIPNIKTKEDILAVVQARKAKNIEAEKNQFAPITTFIEEGGVMNLEIPSFEHIRKAIDAGSPVIALLYAQALGSREGGYHFVVVSGYDSELVEITNPLPSAQKRGWFPAKDFIYGVHASTTAELDNGTFLIASK